MKLKDILKEENWKADKNVITLDGEKVADYSFDRDADGFFIDDVSGRGQKGFDTKGEMIAYIKKNKAGYLKARKNYTSKGYMREGKLNEAEEVTLMQLDSAKQKQVQQFVKFFGGKVLQIWDGIHGNIVDIKMSDSNWRMDTQDLKDLISLKIRWIEFDKQTVSIGF